MIGEQVWRGHDFRRTSIMKNQRNLLNGRNKYKKQTKKYLVFGIIFLVLGIIMLVTGAVSKTMAYGDFVLAIAFLALSLRAKNAAKEEKKDE